MTTHEESGDILIVDDDAFNRYMLVNLLGQLGYRVNEVENGQQALEFLKSTTTCDVILLDLIMPEMDGFELLAYLKAHPRFQHIPVLVISVSESMETILQCIQMGAVDHLPKPYNPILLKARLSASIKSKRLRDMEQEYKERLVAQNHDLDAFARTVAHDLKNPLSTLTGFTELLLSNLDSMSPEKIEDALQSILHSGWDMSRIIDSLLLLARLRQHEKPPEQIVDMENVVSNVLNRLQRQQHETAAKILLPDSWPIVIGYQPWIEELWMNYISNAFKYGGSPPLVELGSSIGDLQIQFWVRDNGDGIPADQQEVLFEEFSRLAPTQAEGHGLGLSIVARIANKLGGKVGFESKEGQGSTFWFALPRLSIALGEWG